MGVASEQLDILQAFERSLCTFKRLGSANGFCIVGNTLYAIPVVTSKASPDLPDNKKKLQKLPPLWSRGNILASHLVFPGLIPGWVSFPG